MIFRPHASSHDILCRVEVVARRLLRQMRARLDDRVGEVLALVGASSSLSSSASVASPGANDNDRSSRADGAAAAATTTTTTAADATKRANRAMQIRREGGPLAFDTRFGALNPFAIYYGLVSIGLELVWFAALTICEGLYRITGGKIDRRRRIPVFLSHVWGTLLMLLTGCFPKIDNGDIVRDFHRR